MFLGVDPNIRDKYGFSASYWAKRGNFTDIMEMLPGALRITKEEYYEHMQSHWDVHGKPGAKKKKGKKGKKKK